MMQNRKAFTLLEVLISIMLLSLVLMALYKSAEILRASNKNLFHHLEKSSDAMKGSQTLYMDLLQADSNITIDKDKEFHRLTLNNTQHSLYGLSRAKVTWLVYKEGEKLLRIEGGEYRLPLTIEQNVAIDEIATNMELFKLYISKKRTKILVVSKILGQETQSFIVQNLKIKVPKKELVGGAIMGGERTPKKDKNPNHSQPSSGSKDLSF